MSRDPYCTLAEAEEFGLSVADIAAWSAATDETKLRALRQATREIDAGGPWRGVPYADWIAGERGVQERAFPRFDPDDAICWPPPKTNISGTVLDLDDDDEACVPDAVKEATALQAISILRSPTRAQRLQDQADGVTSQKAGSMSETYGAGGSRRRTLCREAEALLIPYRLKSGRII